MPHFHLDRREQPGGAHEIHIKARCEPSRFPGESDAQYLGYFPQTEQAVQHALAHCSSVVPCHCCAGDMHRHLDGGG